MSWIWAFQQTDKKSILSGSIFWGFVATLLIGLPVLLLLSHYELDIPIWVGIVFLIIVFPIATYSFYCTGCKRLNKKK